MTIFVNPDFTADALRQALYDGNLVVLTNLRAVSDFVDYTREQLAELFRPHDPEHAHEYVDPEQMAKILGSWKPRFIHAERSKSLVCDIIKEAGLPAEFTHFDLPKPRTSFPVGHLTTGVAFAFPWHRDVWYSAPAQQLNWWLPIFAARDDNAMSFDLQNFDQAVPNTSGTFDYYQNNALRLDRHAGEHRSSRHVLARWTTSRFMTLSSFPPPGGVLLFSGAQLHTSIPNTSGRARYSVDFRTVDARDLKAGRERRWWTSTAREPRYGISLTSRTTAHSTSRPSPQLFGAPPSDAMLVFSAAETERAAESV